MIKCPKCEVVMHEVRKADINIDVCPKCMGIWLDKGELDKIIERTKDDELYSRPEEHSRREDSYKHDDHHDHDDHYKDRYDKEKYYDKKGYPRKRGGISEIFGNLFD